MGCACPQYSACFLVVLTAGSIPIATGEPYAYVECCEMFQCLFSVAKP